MPKQYFFTINLLIKNDSHIKETISSVISDETFFLENIQLILIDSVCSDESIEICSGYSEKFPDNIYFVDTSGKKASACYNDAYPLCTGKYISFIDNCGEYSKKALPILYNILSDKDIEIAAIMPFCGSSPYINDIPSGIVQLKETPDKFILMLGCYFFSKKITDIVSFDTKLKFHSIDKFITEVLLKTYSFLFTENCSYTTFDPTERNFLKFEPQYNKSFYINSVNDFIIPMLKDYAGSIFVQEVMIYLINIKFAMNQNERYKYALTENYIKDFFSSVSQALKYIDDYIILNKRLCFISGLDEEFPFSLVRMKYNNKNLQPDIDLVLFKDTIEKKYFKSNGNLTIYKLNGEFALSINQAFISSSKDITAEISAINFDSNGLYIDALLCNCSYIKENFSLYTLINQKCMDIIPSEIYTTQTFFDMPFIKKFAFKFFVPISTGKQIDNICIMMKYQNLSFRVEMRFNTVFSRLSNKLKNSFWCFFDRILTYDLKAKTLVIRRATDNLTAFYENKFLSNARKFLSFSEFMYYRQLRKNIRNLKKDKNDFKYFIFYDEFGINSNGNLLFRYFSKAKKDKKFTSFFITEKGSPEYNFLINAGYENILEKGSKKAKSITLAADIIFASNSNVYESLGFNYDDRLFLRDMFNAKIISVKNFFMTYNTAQSDNRLKDNIYRCFCSSIAEKNNLLKRNYDYSDAMIDITGYPILDSTFDKKENVILIAPGNRKQFCIYENSNHSRFSESRFFKIYNSLITDTELLNALKENNFRLAVLMPPSIEKYMQFFHSDDIVGLYSYTEKNIAVLISKAAVIVTDYSEFLYKMAYLNKPVIYYFPKNLPLQSEYKNEELLKTSLGEVIYDHNNLVKYLIENIQNGFEQPEKYKKRCDSFFAYRDNKNCRRIFNAVMKYELENDVSG